MKVVAKRYINAGPFVDFKTNENGDMTHVVYNQGTEENEVLKEVELAVPCPLAEMPNDGDIVLDMPHDITWMPIDDFRLHFSAVEQ